MELTELKEASERAKKQQTSIQGTTTSLTISKKTGGEYRARIPFHDDIWSLLVLYKKQTETEHQSRVK